MSQIKSTDAIILFNLKTKNYLSYPVRSTGNWEIVTSGHDECPHTIHVLGKPNGIVKSGELVKFESQATSYEGFNQLYCSSRGFCWYDKINPKDPKQIWRIVRKDKSHVGDDILNGDIVHIGIFHICFNIF